MKQRHWRLKPGILIDHQSESPLILIDTSEAELYQVNSSASTLIPALTTGTTLKSLTTLLHKAFSINLGQARQDVQAFIQQLAHRNLIDAYDD